MGKPLKAAVFAAFIVITGGLAVGMTLGTTLLTTTGALTLAGMAAFTFVTTLAQGLIQKMTSKGINASAGNFGSKFATRAPLAPR